MVKSDRVTTLLLWGLSCHLPEDGTGSGPGDRPPSGYKKGGDVGYLYIFSPKFVKTFALRTIIY